MASQTSICNQALAYLGKDPITSVNEDSVCGRTCKLFWNPTVDSLLRAHPWNFAVKRIALARLTDAPVFGYDYAYQLPSDCLRVLDTDDEDNDYQIEDRALLTDAETISIRYVANVGVGNYAAQFEELVALKLAVAMCYPLTQNSSLLQTLVGLYRDAFQAARAADGQEGYDRTIMGESAWLEIRY